MKWKTDALLAAVFLTALLLGGCAARGIVAARQPVIVTQPVQASPAASNRAEQPLTPEENPPGDIPDSQVFVQYTSTAGGYQLEVPKGWARSTSGADARFTDKLDGVQVTLEQAASAPTAAGARANEVATLEKSGRAVQVTRVEDVQLPGGPTGSEMRALEAFEVYRFYHAGEEETLALRGVSLHLETGEIVALMGPSGSGKSTLLAYLAGLDEPDGGYVQLLGRRLTRRPEAERAALRATHIGILLQSGNLFEQLSVEDNVCLPMRLAHRLDVQRLNTLIAAVGLHERRRARPSELSGGEAARAGLGVALAGNPAVLLADEPTGEVDAESEAQILSLLEARRQEGGAILIAMHRDVLATHANRVVHLLDGRVVDG